MTSSRSSWFTDFGWDPINHPKHNVSFAYSLSVFTKVPCLCNSAFISSESECLHFFLWSTWKRIYGKLSSFSIMVVLPLGSDPFKVEKRETVFWWRMNPTLFHIYDLMLYGQYQNVMITKQYSHISMDNLTYFTGHVIVCL